MPLYSAPSCLIYEPLARETGQALHVIELKQLDLIFFYAQTTQPHCTLLMGFNIIPLQPTTPTIIYLGSQEDEVRAVTH